MSASPEILAVDRNVRNLELLAQFLGKEGYRVRPAATMEEFDVALSNPGSLGFALVDLAGFEQSIWSRCERLRGLGIPLLIISPRQSAAVQQASLAHGAHGVLVKPLAVRELLSLIRTLLGQE